MELKEVIKLGTFTEKRKTGEEITYIIQTAPPEMADEIVEHMTKLFLPREPISKHRAVNDPVVIKRVQGAWKKALLKGTSLIALQILENGSQKLIGVNVTPITEKNDDKQKPDPNVSEVYMAMVDIENRANIFERYNVDRYMSGYGLSVDPDYQGFNVGLRILQSRIPLCRKLGVKATATVFTGPTSQHLAKKIGFEVLGEYEYAKYSREGFNPFENMTGKMQMMGMRIE